MAQFYALALGNAGDYKRELLSCTVLEHLALAAEAAGGQLYLASDKTEGCEITTADFWAKAGSAPVLLFLAPAAGVGADTVKRLVSQTEPACLVAGRLPLAVFGQADALQKADLSNLPGDLAQVQAGPGEGMVVNTAESAYVVQEQLRRRINMEWMQKGVMLVDPNTTHISPKAKLESGCTVLPGCMIHGDSTVAKGAVIGPNTWLKSAHIGENVTVNASQVIDSTVGKNTTVGPFAYIRPGCVIGEKARIGDFVELKNSTIGDGTKVSHLTYVGDSDVGKKVNFGCGTVTVNYDGLNKFRTTIGDNAFIGCNTNLVAPVSVGDNAYTGAGTTITEDVPNNALAIGRPKQINKKDWVIKHRKK